MVVINLKSKVIPVDFGAFQLEFSKSDKNLERLEEFGKELIERSKEIQEQSEESELVQVREMVHAAWDGVFGEGTFDKVYDVAGGSTVDTLAYFLEAMNGIQQEQVNEDSQALLKQYLGD